MANEQESQTKKYSSIRFGNTEIPYNKQIYIALTYVFGIGRTLSQEILKKLDIPFNLRTYQLDEEQKKSLTTYIEKEFIIENSLKKQIEYNIKRLIRIACFRGTRHEQGLPIHGRTSCNAKTHKKLRSRNKRFFESIIS